ncbi:hypothetical protein [Chryseobacterium glaciei]|nr:hypothetical protein [Chryseobacterium glaciei]
MKNIVYLLFIIICSSLYSQTNKRKIRDSLDEESSKNLTHQILVDFKDLNYTKLNQKIISDIDFNQLKNENLVFYFSSLRRPIILISPHDEVSRNVNPAFNQTIFWNKKTIRFIRKKYHKNLIPFLKEANSFLFVKNNKLESYSGSFSSYDLNDKKKLLKLSKKRKKGLILKTQKNSQEEFYYFPFKSKNLTINTNKETENFNTLYLEFHNKLNKIVVVDFIYNLNYNNVTHKTYQYKNNNWEEVSLLKE